MADTVRIPRPTRELVIDRDLCQLYCYLLSRADENGVVETSLATIQGDLNISQKAVRTLISKLERAKIGAKTGAKKGTKITLCNCESYAVKGANKRAKTRAKTGANKKLPETVSPDSVSPSFVAPEFREIWHAYMEYRRERRIPYKSESSERIAYNKMIKMSGGNPEAARDMIERAILGQWQGLYETKDSNNGKRNDNSAQQPSGRGQHRNPTALDIAEYVLSNPAY
jgi:hypothetical protein